MRGTPLTDSPVTGIGDADCNQWKIKQQQQQSCTAILNSTQNTLVPPLRQRITSASIILVYGAYSVNLHVALTESECHVIWMGRKVALAAIALIAWAGDAGAVAPLYDPVMLNVGINCQWQRSCERRQLKAMSSVHSYIARAHPPLWRIHLCNRNARRSISRIDWIGFEDCLRNSRLTRPAPRRR